MDLLSAPSSRPNEPIQNGLQYGPGRGPSALGRRETSIDMLESALAATGDPQLAALVRDLRLRRGER